jgi:hypothetical protein
MKLFSSLIFTLATSAALACPDLNGTFVSADGQERQVISMSEQAGQTVFVWGEGGFPMILDGAEHNVGPASYKASCKADDIVIQMKGDGRVINVTLTKTAKGYKYVSDDPANPGRELIKQN